NVSPSTPGIWVSGSAPAQGRTSPRDSHSTVCLSQPEPPETAVPQGFLRSAGGVQPPRPSPGAHGAGAHRWVLALQLRPPHGSPTPGKNLGRRRYASGAVLLLLRGVRDAVPAWVSGGAGGGGRGPGGGALGRADAAAGRRDPDRAGGAGLRQRAA